MPINRKYKLDTLMGALREEFPRQHENSRGQGKVFFEYLCVPLPLSVSLSRATPSTSCDAERLSRGVQCTPHLEVPPRSTHTLPHQYYPCKLTACHSSSSETTER